MRAGLYIRVSTGQQIERYSLDAQERLLVEHCKRQGWDFEIYKDAGISGETIDLRPRMVRLLEDARARRIQVALAIEIERFSRSESLFDWLVIKQAFRQGQVKFGTPAQLFDPADEEDDFLTDLFGALSKREKKKFLARTLRGKLEASRKGRYIAAHAPFGYRLAGKGQSALVICEPEAAVVRLIFSLLLEGHGIRGIAQELDARGMPIPASRSGRRARLGWSKSTIKRIVHNPAYFGRAAYNQRQRVALGQRVRKVLRPRPQGDWVEVPVPPIISGEVFEQAQVRLRQNAALAARRQHLPYLLRGLVRCGLCGRSMPGVSYHHDDRYHRCMGKNRSMSTPPCPSRAVQAEPLETIVWDELVRLLKQPDVVLEEARRWRQNQVSDRDELEMRCAAVRNALQQVPVEREAVDRLP